MNPPHPPKYKWFLCVYSNWGKELYQSQNLCFTVVHLVTERQAEI